MWIVVFLAVAQGAVCPDFSPSWNSIEHPKVKAMISQASPDLYISRAGTAERAIDSVRQEIAGYEDYLKRLPADAKEARMITRDYLTLNRGMLSLLQCRTGEAAREDQTDNLTNENDRAAKGSSVDLIKGQQLSQMDRSNRNMEEDIKQLNDWDPGLREGPGDGLADEIKDLIHGTADAIDGLFDELSNEDEPDEDGLQKGLLDSDGNLRDQFRGNPRALKESCEGHTVVTQMTDSSVHNDLTSIRFLVNLEGVPDNDPRNYLSCLKLQFFVSPVTEHKTQGLRSARMERKEILIEGGNSKTIEVAVNHRDYFFFDYRIENLHCDLCDPTDTLGSESCEKLLSYVEYELEPYIQRQNSLAKVFSDGIALLEHEREGLGWYEFLADGGAVLIGMKTTAKVAESVFGFFTAGDTYEGRRRKIKIAYEVISKGLATYETLQEIGNEEFLSAAKKVVLEVAPSIQEELTGFSVAISLLDASREHDQDVMELEKLYQAVDEQSSRVLNSMYRVQQRLHTVDSYASYSQNLKAAIERACKSPGSRE